MRKSRKENKKALFTKEEAENIAKALDIDFSKAEFNPEDFYMGVNVELENGTKFSETNVTNNDPI